MPSDEISHGDIYHKLGAVEGKLDAVIASAAEKRADLSEAFRRLGELEKRMAQGVILAVAVGILAPLIWQAIEPQIHLNKQNKTYVPATRQHRSDHRLYLVCCFGDYCNEQPKKQQHYSDTAASGARVVPV
jgi:hypothetical protein